MPENIISQSTIRTNWVDLVFVVLILYFIFSNRGFIEPRKCKPANRAMRFGLEFSVIGENLAFAPDVYIAHQGLMNSQGHKANILSTDFHALESELLMLDFTGKYLSRNSAIS